MTPINDVWLSTLDSYGQSLTQCLKVLGFKRPRKVIAELKQYTDYRNPFYIYHPIDGIKPNQKGRKNGFWVRPEGDGRFNREGLKVTTKGFEWLKANMHDIEGFSNRRLPDGSLRPLSIYDAMKEAAAVSI